MRPLLYLAVRRLINSVKRIPRNPRLLLPTLLLLLAFGLQVVVFVLAGGQRGEQPPPMPAPREFVEGGPGAFAAAVRALLLLSLFGSVASAFGEGSLFFSPSDVDFLFPAPLGRRHVLLFKILGTYTSLILPTAYFAFFLGGSLAGQMGTTPLAYWPGMVGAWLFLVTTVNVTQAALLGRAPGEDDAGRQKVQRALHFLGAALLLAGALVAYRLASGDGIGGLRGPLRAINSGAASVLLLPVAWVSDLFLVAFRGWDMGAWGKLAALVLLAAASFALLFGRDRDFYEGAVEVSARRQRITAALQSGNAGEILAQRAQGGKPGAHVRVPWALGGGARALFWRDLVSAARTPPRSWVSLLVLSALAALMGRGIGGQRGDEAVVFWIFFYTVNVSHVFLVGIRTMLRRADITKALPVGPARFLLGETAFSLLLLTAFGWVSLLLMAALGGGRGPLFRVAFLMLPTLAAVILLVQTCLVLLYPNRADPAQNAVGNLLGFLASALALLPAAAVGTALFLTGSSPLAVALGVSLTNLVAAAAALSFAAFLWQRFDPTD